MTVWATRADQVDLRGPNPHDLARSPFIARRRAERPSEEYRDLTPEEWTDFLGHFELRKVALGVCTRASARAPTQRLARRTGGPAGSRPRSARPAPAPPRRPARRRPAAPRPR